MDHDTEESSDLAAQRTMCIARAVCFPLQIAKCTINVPLGQRALIDYKQSRASEAHTQQLCPKPSVIYHRPSGSRRQQAQAPESSLKII
jgi:hypothetical protein